MLLIRYAKVTSTSISQNDIISLAAWKIFRVRKKDARREIPHRRVVGIVFGGKKENGQVRIFAWEIVLFSVDLRSEPR